MPVLNKQAQIGLGVVLLIASFGAGYAVKNANVKSVEYAKVADVSGSPETKILDSKQEVSKFACMQSGGTYHSDTDSCSCPLTDKQTQEEAYNKVIGYCMTAAGVPGGPIGNYFADYKAPILKATKK